VGVVSRSRYAWEDGPSTIPRFPPTKTHTEQAQRAKKIIGFCLINRFDRILGERRACLFLFFIEQTHFFAFPIIRRTMPRRQSPRRGGAEEVRMIDKTSQPPFRSRVPLAPSQLPLHAWHACIDPWCGQPDSQSSSAPFLTYPPSLPPSTHTHITHTLTHRGTQGTAIRTAAAAAGGTHALVHQEGGGGQDVGRRGGGGRGAGDPAHAQGPQQEADAGPRRGE
jgi:hypothetical protein